jgi:hypothetical protein
MSDDVPKRRWSISLRTMFVVVLLLSGTCAGWIAGEWRTVRERMDVADWINRRNRDIQFTECHGVEFYSESPAGTGLLRYVLGDKLAAWVYVKPPITEKERERIVRAFPEAKQFLHVEESPYKRFAAQQH